MKRLPASALVAALGLVPCGLQAAVAVTKIPSPAAVSAGDVASFLYIVQNGPTLAGNVTLTDTLPSGVTWTENSGACGVTSGTQLACSFGTLPANAQVSVTAAGLTDFADCGTLSSTATVTASTGGSQSTSGVVVLCPSVSASIMPDSAPRGRPFALTIGVGNRGAGTARNVRVSYTLFQPALGWSLSPGDSACTLDATKVSCAFGDLIPGAGHSFRIAAAAYPGDLCADFDPSLTVQVDNQPFSPYIALVFILSKLGDANGDCKVDVADVFALINFLFAGGPAPWPPTQAST
jgi:uncharacterized repeat protein (TIGR01451 family)